MPKLFVFTGAGASADSGIPTFRDAGGLWDHYRIEDVCDYTTWAHNFEAVHAFYNARRSELATVQPNAAHLMIADWQRRYDTTLMTTNVDDLHERAGSTDVVHLHGYLTEMQCTACGHRWNIGFAPWDLADRCPNPVRTCQSIKCVKPGVVFFNEFAPRYPDLYRAVQSLEPGDCAVVIGASGQVIPMGIELRAAVGTYKILNNLAEDKNPQTGCGIAQFDHYVYKPASKGVFEIDAILREFFGSGRTS